MTLLIIYESYMNATDTRKTIKEYDSYDDALTVFHSELAKAIPDSNVKAVTVALAGTGLNIVKRETYSRPAETAEATEEA